MTDMTVQQQMDVAIQELDTAWAVVREIILDMKFINRDAPEWKAAAEKVADATILAFNIKNTNAEIARIKKWRT